MAKAIVWVHRGFGAALLTLGFVFAGSASALAAPPSTCSHGAHATAFNKGFNKGFNVGFDRGFDRGFQVGFRAGFLAASLSRSSMLSVSQCYDKGYNAGFDKGFNKGFDPGFNKGFDTGFNRGFRARHHHHG